MANNAGKSSDDFHWHKVTPEVNRTGNDNPAFNNPTDPDAAPGK
ncbi:hypothetical protein [Paraburkholderia sp. GAS334]